MSLPGPRCPSCQQIRDLNRGSYGAVELALDRQTGQEVAIKYMERGAEVGAGRGGSHGSCGTSTLPRPWQVARGQVLDSVVNCARM